MARDFIWSKSGSRLGVSATGRGLAIEVSSTLEAHQLQVLLAAGDPAAARGAPPWKRIRPEVR